MNKFQSVCSNRKIKPTKTLTTKFEIYFFLKLSELCKIRDPGISYVAREI